jgi:hypothetical protein
VNKTVLIGTLLLGLTSAAQAAGPSFSKDLVPILKTQCAICHLTGQEQGNLALPPAKAYASLVNVKSTEAPALTRVTPGQPDKSYLIAKLEGTQIKAGGKGARMPFAGTPLPAAQVKLFRDWIAAGAANN